MNLTVLADGDNVFANCECIKGYTFKMVAPRGKSVHLENDLALLRDKSALLTAATANIQAESVHMTVLDASHHINVS